MAERVAENLNQALCTLFATDPSVYLLGEDVLDPYGGAFKITKGLSTKYPDRVMTTPLSEGALVGVAGGLALTGQKAIIEMMFSDFVALAFDQILNFAAKSVTMYGRRLPIPIVVRCPTGGNRGYGPTHSQSLQKHFLGMPGLSLYEVSPFRDNHAVLTEALSGCRPSLLFEDKVLYTQRMHLDGHIDDIFRVTALDESGAIAVVRAEGISDCDCVLIVPGGLADRALTAARSLLYEDELLCQIVVPSRLYPVDLDPMLPVLRAARRVCVVEESAAGGTWGAEIAHLIHSRLWNDLHGPVHLIHSADSVIPTAPHLEQQVLVQATDIHRAVKGLLLNA